MCNASWMKVLNAGQNLLKVSLCLLHFHANIRFWFFWKNVEWSDKKTLIKLLSMYFFVLTNERNRLLNWFFLPIRSNSSPPAAYSRNMYSIVPWLRLPKNLRMLGCESIFCMQTSFFTDAAASECFLRSTIFIATASPEILLTSNLTLHKHHFDVKGEKRKRDKIEQFIIIECEWFINIIQQLTRHMHLRQASVRDSNSQRTLEVLPIEMNFAMPSSWWKK